MSSSSYKLEGELMLRMVILVLTVLTSITCADGSVEAESRRSLLANGLALTPPMGGTAGITSIVLSMRCGCISVTGLSKLGYHYVNIDDCWAEKNRDSKGRLVPRRSTFPSGMKALADYIHGKGLKLGIYSDAGYQTCSQTMPGSLGHEKKDAKTFASWISVLILSVS